MSIWGKIFGGTSGFVVGGPLGGLLGIFAGHAVDKFNKNIALFVKQVPNIFSFFNTKFLVYFGLAAYWSVMLLGTFIGI